jgi:hypothetical protein
MAKHSKRNKGGHKFRALYDWQCKCGLALYDWQCKWLWS